MAPIVITKWIWLIAFFVELRRVRSANYTEEDARKFMSNYNKEFGYWANKMNNALWNYENNLTSENLELQLKVSSEFANMYKKMWSEATNYLDVEFTDSDLVRQMGSTLFLGRAALTQEKQTRLEEIVAKMSDIYSTTNIVAWEDVGCNEMNKTKGKTISIEPELTELFADYVNDSCRMQFYWEGWHGSVGRKVKALFEEYVQLSNEAARLNNISDVSVSWIADFEMENFEKTCRKLYEQILPLYKQLHAYVRRKLPRHHNKNHRKLIQRHGCLPAHILGNVWAESWQHLYELTAPYPDKKPSEITTILQEKNFTPLKMFEIAEDFYKSINMSEMTKTFWKRSIFEKPKDRDIVCHASAWDFSNGDDFRIKMCTRLDQESFFDIHHEMGHIEYYMAYKDQPFVFQSGANSGFHEAVGDTITLSVSTPKHLIKIGLLDNQTYVEDKETEINTLYTMALDKVAFLPFAYVLDLWRWEVFRGNITANEYNCRYWQLRQELQGIVPPSHRGAQEFDAGAKFHIIADVPYIRYFVSFIIQFQFHKALCIKAGQYDPNDPASKPLHQCDIYQSKEAGNLFSEMLRMGSSRPWQDAMGVLTGQREMDAGPLMEYFQPLYDWLVKENKRAKAHIGWSNEPKIDCSNKGRVKSVLMEKDEDKNCRYIFPRKKSKNDDSNEE